MVVGVVDPCVGGVDFARPEAFDALGGLAQDVPRWSIICYDPD